MINVGILGLAHGHSYAVAGEWNAHSESLGVRATAFWDSDESRCNDAAKKLPGIKRCGTPNDLLDSGIDAVLITCETAYHSDMVRLAAEKGKDIILYKPMALKLRQADDIVNCVNETGVRFTMAWQMRCDPENIRMREICRSDELGRVCMFKRRHGLSVHKWDGFEHTWHNDPALNRDIFADDSSHPIDLMQWFFGMPDTVMCEMTTMFDSSIPNDSGVALFKYPNGMIAEISLCFTTCAADPTTEIYLTDGSVIQRYGDAPGTKLKHDGRGLKWYKWGDEDWTYSDIHSPTSQAERLRAQAQPLAEFLHGGKAICSAEDGRNSLRLVLACYLSSKEGKRVSVYSDELYEI